MTLSVTSLRDRGLISDRVSGMARAMSDDTGSLRGDPELAAYLGSTSNDGKSLSVDDGSVRRSNRGAIKAGHIDDKVHQKSRSKGFSNPMADWGAADAASSRHIDRAANRRPFPKEARVTGRPISAQDKSLPAQVPPGRKAISPLSDDARRLMRIDTRSRGDYYADGD
jgi:hypothetical protein